MLRTENVDSMKAILRKEVTSFCNGNRVLWKQPIVRTINEIKEMNLRAVFFGGTLRSLLMSRLVAEKQGRPRDIDIVIQGVSIAALQRQFAGDIVRETRFGGLQLRRMGWQLDVWPLENTWAFCQDESNPDFASLPQTTFFNLEAIAVEIWPAPGRPRTIFSGDDQFFHGIIDRTLEVNREDNPFPELCIVRALIFAAQLDFQLGPRLAAYISKHGQKITEGALEYVQLAHYGFVRHRGTTMCSWIQKVVDAVSANSPCEIRLPQPEQMTFHLLER